MHVPSKGCDNCQCTAGIQDRDDGWRISLGIALVPAVIFAFGSAILYDTPASILHLDPDAEAKARMVRGLKALF